MVNTTPESGPHESSDRSQSEVEEDLYALGFEAQFGARPGAMILCFTCRREFPAADIDASGASRTEGESDPDDMSMVVPERCPNCGTAGVLAIQYGPGASEEEAEVLAALGRRTPSTPLAIDPEN